MTPKEIVFLLNNGIVPVELDYNIKHTEIIEYHKLEYNNIEKTLLQNKLYKVMYTNDLFKGIIDMEIKDLKNSGATLLGEITYRGSSYTA